MIARRSTSSATRPLAAERRAQCVDREMRVGALRIRRAEEDRPGEEQDRELLRPDDRRAEKNTAQHLDEDGERHRRHEHGESRRHQPVEDAEGARRFTPPAARTARLAHFASRMRS